jgi:hypothetical protein
MLWKEYTSWISRCKCFFENINNDTAAPPFIRWAESLRRTSRRGIEQIFEYIGEYLTKIKMSLISKSGQNCFIKKKPPNKSPDTVQFKPSENLKQLKNKYIYIYDL